MNHELPCARITDEALLDVNAGCSSPSAAAHVESCPACQARLGALLAEVAGLAEALGAPPQDCAVPQFDELWSGTELARGGRGPEGDYLTECFGRAGGEWALLWSGGRRWEALNRINTAAAALAGERAASAAAAK